MGTPRLSALVVFGATGDLAKLETFPALVGLVDRGVLDVPIVGVARASWGREGFRAYAADSLRLNGMDPDADPAKRMLDLLDYVEGDLTDDATYAALARVVPPGPALYYLEVPPALFGTIATGLARAGLTTDARVMVEKPFGTDLASARQLDRTLHAVFPEDSVYRVDHWLGLDPVANLVFARFANAVLEPVLDRTHVRHIQITMAEAFDVSDRGRFYDRTGALRDVVQNHMLQVLSLVLMDPPPDAAMASLRAERAGVIAALEPFTPAGTVRGQYEGYQQVAGVAPGSTTETFAAVRTTCHTWRWAGVPILIRAGKCLPVTATEIVIRFHRPPTNVFGLDPFEAQNSLRFRIWPETEMGLSLVGKAPGPGVRPETQELVFAQSAGGDMRPYDRLIGAALDGHRFLFARQDTVEAAWRVVDPVLGDVVPVERYAPGTWPGAADRLLPEGETWHDPR